MLCLSWPRRRTSPRLVAAGRAGGGTERWRQRGKGNRSKSAGEERAGAADFRQRSGRAHAAGQIEEGTERRGKRVTAPLDRGRCRVQVTLGIYGSGAPARS